MTALIAFVLVTAVEPAGPVGLKPRVGAARADAVRLDFAEMLAPDPGALRPSSKVTALAGKRVRLVGYMAHMTIAPRGAFYLVPKRLFCDEAGGGSADLPPTAVRVVVPSASGHEIAFNPRPLEVTGVLEVGNHAEDDGHTSNFRIVLDGPLPRARKRAALGKE
jgi:hypothetical protein